MGMAAAGLQAQSLGEALNTNLTWTTGGNVYILVPSPFGYTAQYLDPSWTAETNVALDGRAAQSAGPITASDEESWIQTSTTNSGFLFFSWKANLTGYILAPSTHEGSKLELYLNNNLKQTVINGMDWTPQFLYCDGTTNTVRWRRAMDPVDSPTDTSHDTAWLDEVTFIPDPMSPQIWSQPVPQSQKVAEGTTVNISATAIGTPPLFYQWQQNGTDVSGATNSTLTLTNVTVAQAGGYSLTVSNASGVVTSSNATLQVVPMMPLNKVAQWPGYERSAAQGVAVKGNLVFIGNEYWDTYGAFLVLDASNPANPVLVGKLEGIKDTFNILRVTGNYVYAGMWGGLSVIDVSNPAQPQVVTNLNLGGITDLQIVGNYAYAITYNSGLVILDISNPAQPAFLSSPATVCYPQGVSVVGNYAYVVGRCGGNLAAVDISNPTNPVLVGTLAVGGLGADTIAVTNNTAFIGTWNNMVVVDVSQPTNMMVVTNLNGYTVRLAGDKAYIGNGYSLDVMDISTPTNPVQIAACNLNDYIENIDIVGNLVYVANWQNGLTIVDAANAAAPAILGTYAAGAEAYGIDVMGNFAYLADAKGGLQIFDISNPMQPVPVGRYWTGSDGGAAQVKVVGNLAYISFNSAGLRIVDVSDPSHPLFKGACTNVYAESADVYGHYAYVGGGFNGLQIVDVADPANPVQIAQTNITVGVNVLAVSGHYLYLAPWYENSMMVLDISNPTKPVEVSDNPFSSQPWYNGPQFWNMFIQGNQLFGGGQIVDISNPTNPVVVGQYNHNGYVECVGTMAFVADGYGLSAIDFSVPPSVEVGHTNLTGWSEAVKIAGQYAFVADDDWGLQVFQLPTNFIAGPTLSTQMPANQTAFAGDNLTLAANATGQPPMSYQWYFNDAPITGGTNWVLTFTNIQTIAAGDYSIVVTNGFGAVTNQTMLTVVVRPNIIASGTNAFGFDASGQFRLAFQTQIGAQYAVEYVNSLGDTNWTVLTNVWGNDLAMQVVDPSPTNASRFYRVRKE